MKKYIQFPINQHPITGMNRIIRFKRVQFLDYDIQEGEIWWTEHFTDENSNTIEDDIMKPRIIISTISNSNKVTKEGILITKEYVESLNPIEEYETDEDYDIRLDEAYQEKLNDGIPEFDFWITALDWDKLILQAGHLLNEFKRFDRK